MMLRQLIRVNDAPHSIRNKYCFTISEPRYEEGTSFVFLTSIYSFYEHRFDVIAEVEC